MNIVTEALNWFSGGDPGYMRLYLCMKRDWFWIGTTVTLDLVIASGYVMIASHWWKNQRGLPDGPAKRALAQMRNIFIFCGLCGYIFIPVKMFWPAWRLYDFALMALAYYTWQYALTASNFKVVYGELGRSTRLAADLERSQQESQRKSQFLNSLSHDLRTPLNGLALQTSVAEMCLRKGDQEALAHALAEIRGSTRATANLLDSLLECARADWSSEPNRINAFSLDVLLQEIVAPLQTSAKSRSLYLRAASTQGLMIHTDRTKLERILTNLVTNSIKFTHEGGVRLEVDVAHGGIEIQVIDSGVGISAADHERLFDEFFQIHNHERDPSKGFGLGLSIARRLARQLGGDIMVDSAPGRGSRFSVVLPNTLAGAVDAAAVSREGNQPLSAAVAVAGTQS